MKAVALVGAQAGSEGKGAVAAALAHDFNVHVRTGGPNAGHTFYEGGEKFVARGLPVGWVNLEAELVIGPGAILDWELLLQEIDEAEGRSGLPRGQVRQRVHIHPNAGVVTQAHHQTEGGVHGAAHLEIGSTGEGVGMARIARINRRALLRGAEFAFTRARAIPELQGMLDPYQYRPEDVVLLEGTQGSKLSLTHGPWPYVTSADTNSAQLLGDAGISPGAFEKTILVARTFPIRVAGNSGPLPDETTWETVGVPEERTTVTGKVRRVAFWDYGWVADAIRLNWPAELVVTFLDYLFPDTEGMDEWAMLPKEAKHWIAKVEERLEVPVVGVGTGPRSLAFREDFSL